MMIIVLLCRLPLAWQTLRSCFFVRRLFVRHTYLSHCFCFLRQAADRRLTCSGEHSILVIISIISVCLTIWNIRYHNKNFFSRSHIKVRCKVISCRDHLTWEDIFKWKVLVFIPSNWFKFFLYFPIFWGKSSYNFLYFDIYFPIKVPIFLTATVMRPALLMYIK